MNSIRDLATGVTAFLLLAVNTVLWSAILMTLSLVKLAMSMKAVRKPTDRALNAIATQWIRCNGWIFELTQRTRWDVAGIDQLSRDDWYIVICNHQSWVDIFALQRVLGQRIPMLKFFLKRELIFIPVIGLSWWALDFPFLRRNAKSALRKHPELRQQDRLSTRRACEKFALVPTSVMSFPEGTRFTEQKHRSQGNALRHLLRPKAGALAMSLNAMGEQFKSLLDVTIVYPDGVPTFWGFLCGRCARVVVRVHQVALTPDLVNGDYAAELAFRQRFHRWLDELWQRKDAEIALLIESAGVPPPRPDDTVAVESLAQFHTVRGSRAAPTGDEMRH